MKINGSLSKISLFLSFFMVFGASILRGQVKPYDILISEIMAKPLANTSLPNAEYIELYNRSSKPIPLKDFKIKNGNSRDTLESIVIEAGKYLILCDKSDTSKFNKYGVVLGVNKFNSLGNLKDNFFLFDKNGVVIDAIDYDKLDYKSSAKSQGGYSLERTNLTNPCNFNDWTGSNDPSGGTPGRKNSFQIVEKDALPQIDYYYLKDKTVEIQFDRAINRNINSTMFYFKNNVIPFESIQFDTTFQLFNKLKITLTKVLVDSIKYFFIIKSDLKNCDSSLSIGKNDTLLLQNSKILDSKDTVLINEVLINPKTGGSRYLEIYNKSSKVIDVSKISVSADTISKKVENVLGYLLFPNSYLVLADNPVDVQTRYNVSKLRRSFLKYKLPSWNQNEGIVLLKYDGKIRDSLFYAKNFFNPLLPNSYDGVSLERINPNKPTNDKSNWQSAAATVGYGTPAYRNSQYLEDTPSVFAASEEVFSIPKPTFSPDDDGFEDYLLLHYKLDKAGAFVKVSVFDVKGHLVKKWIDNEPLATEGALKWDGETDEIIKAPIGIYIVYIELILPTGEVQVFKKTISLTTRL
jgi:hypothetical protein